MTGLPAVEFVAAYTAPAVTSASGAIVIVIVFLLCASVVLALFFSSPLAARLTGRHDTSTRSGPGSAGAAHDDRIPPGSSSQS